MLNSLGLGFMFTATDLASGVMGKLQGNLKSLERVSGQTIAGLEQGMNRFLIGMTGVAGAAVGVVGAFRLADAAGEFEQAVAAAGAVSKASAAEMDLMKKAALGMATDLGSTPVQAMGALQELAAAGYSAKESIDLLRPTLELAAGSLGKLSPEEAAGLASQALKAFGIDSKLAGVAVDQMLSAVNSFALSASDLPQALGIASRGAQTMNQSLTETIVAVGLVKNVIPGIERGSTAVATSMERMVHPDTQAGLKKIGVSVVDATGNFRPFLDIVGDMLPALNKMTIAERGAYLEHTFGTHALGGLTAILTQLTMGVKDSNGQMVKGAAAVAALRKQTIYSEGTAAEFSKRMLETYEGAKKLANAKFDRAMIAIGAAFATVLTPAIRAVTWMLSGLATVVESMPLPMKIFAAVVGLSALALVGLIGAAVALGALVPLYKAGMLIMSGSMAAAATSAWALATGVWAALAPFIAWIALGAVIIGVILALVNNWWGLTDAIVEISTFIWEAITELGASVWGSLVGAFNAVKDAVASAFNSIVDSAVGAFTWVRDVLGSFASWAWGWVKTLAQIFVSPFVTMFNIASVVVGWCVRLLTAIGKQIAASFLYWVEVVRNSAFWKWIAGAVETVKNYFVGLWEGVVEIFGFVIGIAKNMIQDFVQSWVRAFQVVRDEVLWVVDIFWQGFTTIGRFVADWATRIGTVIWNAVMGFVQNFSAGWVIIREQVGRLGSYLADVFIRAFAIVGGWIDVFVAWIKGKVQWVADFVTGIVNTISGLISKVGGFITGLPDWISKNAEATVAVTPGDSISKAAASAPAGSGSTMPAVAQSEAAQAAVPQVSMALDYAAMAAAMKQQPITTVVKMDSDTLITAVNRTQRSINARAGRPVGAQ